jgi:hypothetical protein
MSITYTWSFNPLDVTYQSASLQNVVTGVHWRVHATTEGTSSLGVSGSFTGDHIGNERLDSAPSASFTNFDDITHNQVFTWVTSSMGDTEYNAVLNRLSSSLATQMSPTTGTKNSPW